MLRENNLRVPPWKPPGSTMEAGTPEKWSICTFLSSTMEPILALSGFHHGTPYRYLPWGWLL